MLLYHPNKTSWTFFSILCQKVKQEESQAKGETKDEAQAETEKEEQQRVGTAKQFKCQSNSRQVTRKSS